MPSKWFFISYLYSKSIGYLYSVNRNIIEENEPIGQTAGSKDFYPYLWHRFYALQPEFMEKLKNLNTADKALDEVNQRLSKKQDNAEEMHKEDDNEKDLLNYFSSFAR